MSLRTVAGETPQLVPLDEGLAADRLLGGDVVLDDRAQHVELALVEVQLPPPSVTGTPVQRVPVYVAGAVDGDLRRAA